MSAVDQGVAERFVRLAGERLRGDWVVLGGAVLPLLGIAQRVTLDIDVAPPDDAGQDQMNELLRIALELGLPAEAVNPAGAFFLREFPDWRRDLVVHHRGPGATLLVPNATLFVLSKIGRLSATDLEDCLAMLRAAGERGEDVDRARIRGAIHARRSTDHTPQADGRLDALERALGI